MAVDTRDGSKHIADGRLVFINSSIDQTNGEIQFRAVFTNTDRVLWPGEFVSARVLVRTDRNATVVPSQAVQTGQNGLYVYVLKPDQTVSAQPVTAGPSVNGFTEIRSGLASGQRVILDGQSRLAPGSHVTVAPDSAQPGGRPAGRARGRTMSISRVFIYRRIGTCLLAIGVVLIGLVAYRGLPVSALPLVDFPTIQVEAILPGASAQTMATSVATPLERSFSNIAGVTQMTSSSSLGITTIVLQFDLNRNIDGAAQDVQTEINATSGLLPKDMPNPPTYNKVNPADTSIISLALTSPTLPLTELDRYAEDFIAQPISQLPGVGLVDYHGQLRPAVRVSIDPEKLAGAWTSRWRTSARRSALPRSMRRRAR